MVQQRHDGPAPRRDLADRLARRARGGSAGSGRLAHFSETEHAPANISLLPLPPKSPDLNPTENVWQYLRDNWLSNRVFVSIHHHPPTPGTSSLIGLWTIMSIGLRDWAYG